MATDRFEVDWWLNSIQKGPVTETVTFALGTRTREDTRERFLDAFARGLSVISFETRESQRIYGLGVVHAD